MLTEAEIRNRIVESQAKIEARKRRMNNESKIRQEMAKDAVAFSILNKLRFCHIRRTHVFDYTEPKGGITVCYSQPRNSSVITFAVSQCSPKDVYCKASGRINSVDQWKMEHHIHLLKPKKMKAADFLRDNVFAYMAY